VYVETPFQRGGTGNGLFTGENPPFGAILGYRLYRELPAGSEVVITVKDAAGREIAQVIGPAGVGLNRAVWNLREAPATTGAGRGAAAGGGRGGAGGAGTLVAPGSYTVQLNRHTNGTLTPMGAPQPLRVIPLEGVR
jgi:hypothetical protein